MKFKVAQENLAGNLQLVQRAAAARPTIPILSGVLVETSSDGLTLTATDNEIGIRLTLPAMIAEDGAFVFPGRLGDIVRKIPFGEIAFEIDRSNNTANISWGRSRFVIHGYSAAEFPSLPEPGSAPALAVSQTDLCRLIRQTGFAASHDDSRPVFTGVLLVVAEGKLRFVATDGFRLALAEASADIPADQTFRDVIIPSRALAEVAHVLGEEGDGPVRIAFSDNRVFFEASHERVVCRLIEGQFPPYKQVIPQSFVTRLGCNTQDFLSACERASLIAHEVGQAVKLEISATTMVISASKPELGNVREEISVESQGDPLEIAFNPRYVIDGLRNISAERMAYEFTGPLSPTCMSPEDGKQNSFTYVVLPMRVG